MWQEVGVVLVVGGAIVYLVRKIFGRPRKGTSTFVPLAKVKRRDEDCH